MNSLRTPLAWATVVKYAGFAARSIQQHGWRHSLATLAAECWFDLRWRTDTFSPCEVQHLHVPAAAAADAIQYQGADPRLVQRLLAALPPATRHATFVDYGCGKGRVLLLAQQAGFTKLVGVEFSAELAAIGQANLLRHRRPNGSAEVCIHVLDAAQFEPPSGPLVAFLYNPFHGATLRRVVEKLRLHAAQHVGATQIIYVNPRELTTFTDAGFTVTQTVNHRRHLLAVTLALPNASVNDPHL